MEKFSTITEYQLLYLARNELLRRLDRLEAKKVKTKTRTLKKRDECLFNLYSEQVTEINERMAKSYSEGRNTLG